MAVGRTTGAAEAAWTYDEGGYVLFENGKVRFRMAPRVKK